MMRPSFPVGINQWQYCHPIIAWSRLLCKEFDIISKPSSISPNHPAHIGITCPHQKRPYVAWNGPTTLFSPLSTTSEANNLSIFELQGILIDNLPCSAFSWSSYYVVVCILWLHAVYVFTSKKGFCVLGLLILASIGEEVLQVVLPQLLRKLAGYCRVLVIDGMVIRMALLNRWLTPTLLLAPKLLSLIP